MAKTLEYLSLDDIVALFTKHWDITIKRPSVYFYINKKGFPPSTGRGRPRKWRKAEVDAWFKAQDNS